MEEQRDDGPSETPQTYLAALRGSSTVSRIEILRKLLQELNSSDLNENDKSILLQYLPHILATYPRYFDRQSRRGVQSCLRAYLHQPWCFREALRTITKFLTSESQKEVVAVTNAFVLLEWCNIIQQEASQDFANFKDAFPKICSAAALFLDKCEEQGVRKSIRDRALVVAKSGIRNILRRDEDGEMALKFAVKELTTFSAVTPKNAPYIGVLAETSHRLPQRKEQFAELKYDVLDFYVKHILGSKFVIPIHQALGLQSFFKNFISLKDFTDRIVPALEKSILRSPEVVLRGPIIVLASSVSPDIDISPSVFSKLLKPILSSTSSNNVSVREGSSETLQALLKRGGNNSSVQQIVLELASVIKASKTAAYEVRGFIADSFRAISMNSLSSVLIVETLLAVAPKEANETALTKELNALAVHLGLLLQNDSFQDSSRDIILKNCNDKRPTTRKLWILSIAGALDQLKSVPSNERSQAFITTYLNILIGVHEEVSANPLPAVQNGLVAVAFVLPVLKSKAVFSLVQFESKLKEQLDKELLSMKPKPSFLLNAKVYTRLSSSEDCRWALKALSSIASDLSDADAEVRNGWARAILQLLLSSEIEPDVRRETGTQLSALYHRDPETIGQSIVLGIWDLLGSARQDQNTYEKQQHSVGDIRLTQALRRVNPPKDSWTKLQCQVPFQTLEKQSVSTVVLLQPELLANADWISTCLNIGVDPGNLARIHHVDLLKEILEHFPVGKFAPISAFERAAAGAGATLAFVDPDTIIPLLITQFQDDLNAKQLSEIGPTEAAIAQTPEGSVFVDVLSGKSDSVIENKSMKDYDVLKWEEEIRIQLAQKKGAQPKKLTLDQQTKVDAQMRHEATIRQKVQTVSSRLRRGAALIQSLATGPPTDTRVWLSSAITALIGALEGGAALLIDDDIVSAYLACANRVADRLGSMRSLIGTATLRSLHTSNIPSSFLVEPLGDLGTRVLYRLRFAAEQLPFDTASMAYTLPLIFSVLDQGGIGQVPSDDADAQVLLALEYLSYQMSACTDSYLPRNQILRHLINSMQRYAAHYRIIKESLLEFCRSVSGSVTNQERNILLSAVTSPQVSVRSAALQALHSGFDLSDMEYSVHIWIACQDEEDENAETALAIWEEHDFRIQDSMIDMIPPFLFDKARSTRAAASKALAQALLSNTSKINAITQDLEASYRIESQPLVPKRNKFGILQKGDLIDHWDRRSGIALAFKELADVFEKSSVVPLVNFIVSEGPLADRNNTVRAEMVDAGRTLISLRGKENLELLMELFEDVLQEPDKGTQQADWVNEAVIVLYGSLARHLPEGDSRIQDVISKLIDTLSTPSEPIQYAVSTCLSPIVRPKTLEIGSYITSLLEQLFQAKKFAARRGAAYGLAGIVQGKGVSALRQYRIMSTLRSATENKKSADHRQGALFAYELFSLILARRFEPYVVEVLPQLLACFGDPSASVREACLDTAKTCFASLSSFGVRQVLPQLLEGLDETQWRSKKGACDLLGAMAYLDPQQLASSLPDIIPPLTAVLTDSHKEVRAAANNSLQRFGEVITNPEVKGLINVLLKALSDPTKYTEEALDGLIKISFVHYLDAPSLALVVRILERGLNDRSSTKRKSAQIIGSLAHLTEKRDIVTHLPILVSGLRMAAIDPVPATRATASKALGSLIEKLGEDAFPDLIPSLMSSLRTDTGASDRLGSAQALSEVLAGLGTGRLEETLPTILQNVSSARATVREGFMTLFIFLPACFGNGFANYLSQIIPSVLSGLADDIEAIRETALRAGRLLVKNFASRSIDLLLPELQRGLADNSHRIRLSSVELVGDLLFSLTGISANVEQEDEEESAIQAGPSLLEVLGEERRNKVLSSLYICRCDTSGLVRSAAINVWKALVSTPRTLREIVPTLSQMIIERLGSSNMEQKVIAGNALGEVIRKAGEGVFASLLPSLEEGLHTSTDADNRQGICIALREIVNAAQPETLEEYEKKLISIVRLALVDSNPQVREAAAESFDAFQQTFGKRAVDQVLPYLLNLLRNESEAENALSALLTLLTEATRANVILPNLIPTLLTNPISAFNARALASLAKVGGSSMNRRLPIILNTLADNMVVCKDAEVQDELDRAFDAVLASIDEFDGLNSTMSVMLAMVKHDDHRKRALAATHLATFFATPTVDYSRYNQDLIRVLLISFGDRDNVVVSAAWTALTQLQSHLRKEEMESLVPSTRQVLQQTGTSGSILPGFALPKGILPVLQIFLQGLMNGTTDQRVQAALGISDIIERTGPDSLKPFVTQITGPLIRVVGERSMDVKCAILFTLNQLLEKIPTLLRPFLPQLQRTFTKSMADSTSEVLRNRATKALSTLITLTPRVDPLITELVTGTKTSDAGVRNAMLKGLQDVVSKVGANMSDASRESILGLMDSQQEAKDDNMMVTYARLLGAMIKVLPAEKAAGLIKSRVVVQPSTFASILALNAVLLESATALTSNFAHETQAALTQGINNKSHQIEQNAVLATGKYLLSEGISKDQGIYEALLESLANVIRPGGDIDTKRLAFVVIRTVSRHHPSSVQPFLSSLVPPVFSSVRDPVIPVKLAAEVAFLQLFDVVESESRIFDEYMAGPGKSLPMAQQRPMSDYFKRVALRLGAQARERNEAEGGQGGLGLSSDEQEDEREVWSVGKVDLGEAFASE